MSLTGIKEDNHRLLLHAIETSPSLFIDCDNCANPHALFPYPFEKMSQVYVIQAELIYKFRDILKELPNLLTQLPDKTNNIIISSFNKLMNYQDKEENNNIFDHCWELLEKHGKQLNILIGVHKKQEERAKEHCKEILPSLPN